MRRGLLLVPVVILLLAGCAPTVSLRPAPAATSVGCAGIVVRLPDSIGSAGRRTTDAQGTAAWGTPTSVTLTCGVATPRATTTTCVTIGGVDWLLDTRTIGGVEWNVATTFGRDPGTQLYVDTRSVSVDETLNAVSDAVAAAAARTGVECLSAPAPTASS